MKRYLTIFVALFLFIIKVNAENYETGDLISYKNIKFYVMQDNGDYLTLLKATPLTWDEVKNYVDELTLSSNCEETGNCAFDDVKKFLDEWSKQFESSNLINASATYIVPNGENYNSSISVTKKYKVRLLTLKELTEDFGYIKDENNDDYDDYYPSVKTPVWLYNSNYFLMDYGIAKMHYSNGYYHYSDMGFHLSSFHSYGDLRPVINLSKKAEIKNLNPAVKKITDKEFKIGDIVELNGIDFYVIKNSDGNDKKVTLLKATPLTVDEVNKYGVVNGINYINKYTNEYVGTAKDVVGYGAVAYYTSSDCGYDDSNNYTSSGCKYDYESSDLKQIIDNWSKSVLGLSNTNFGDNGFEVRILTTDDLTNNLGYTHYYLQTSDGYSYTENTPEFMKQGYSCWVKETDGDILAGHGNFYHYNRALASLIQVCPVITINKQLETDNNKKNDLNNTENKVSIPDTLLKNPVFIVVVGIVLIVIATATVSLVIKRKK